MFLYELKEYLEKFPEDDTLPFGLSEPFSWRGVYSEVAFAIIKSPTPRRDSLENIEKAFTNTFYGYKGGCYQFGPCTTVNFEQSPSSWSDGDYREEIISEILGEQPELDRDKYLVQLLTRDN